MKLLTGIALALAALPGGATGQDDQGPVISYELPADGRVSLAVYDAEGRQVRTLLNAEPRGKGRHRVFWDGLDASGRPLPAGEYAWKGLHSPGLEAEWLLNLGTSSGIDHWPSQHGGPAAALVHDDGIIAGGAPEGSPLLAKIGFDGRMRWQMGQKRAPEGLADLGLDGNRLYILQESSRLDAADPATGKDVRVEGRPISYRLWVPARKLDPVPETRDRDRDDTHRARKIDLKLPGLPDGRYLLRIKARLGAKAGSELSCTVKGKNDRKWFGFGGIKPGQSREIVGPLSYDNQDPFEISGGTLSIEFLFRDGNPEASWAVDEMELLSACDRIDARDGSLVAVFAGAETLAWIDPASGKILEQRKVPGLRDASLRSADEAVAAAGDRLVAVKRDGSVRDIAGSLENAFRVAVSRTDGTIYAVSGKAGHRVEVFGRDGGRRAVLGRPEGRRPGRYRPEDFAGVNDIACDGAGGFVVAEWFAAPRRVARFDARGKLLGEWFGGQQFYTWASPDPEDPGRVLMDSQWGWVMDVEVDYAQRTWKPQACYSWGGEIDGRLWSNFKMASRHHVLRRDLDGDGKTERLVWHEGALGTLFRIDEDAGVLRPVALAGEVNISHGYPNWKRLDELPSAWLDAVRKLGKKPEEVGDRAHLTGYTWADPAGHGKVTVEGMRLVSVGGHGFGGPDSPKPAGGAKHLDGDLNLWFGAEWGDGRPVAEVMRVQGYTKAGAPIWDWSVPRIPFPASLDSGHTVALARDGRGNLYQLSRGGGDRYATGGVESWNGHGQDWPATQTAATGLIKWSPDGKRLWQVGPHASQFNAPGWNLQFPVCIAGFVKGCVGVADKVVNPCSVWTEDGLYVGTVLDRRAADGLPDRVYAWWRADRSRGDEFDNLACHQYDMILGGRLFELKDGSVVWFGAGWNNVPVYRIRGWDAIRRFEGRIQVGARTASVGAGTGLKAAYFANPRWEGAPALARLDERLWFGGRGLSQPGRKGETREMRWPDHDAVKTPCSARWTGLLEPRFTEPYTISVYSRNGRCRVWIGGRRVIDNARLTGDDHARRSVAGGSWKEFSGPIDLQAGVKVPIRVDWEGRPAEGGELHVNWESASQPVEHLPRECLYPEEASPDLPVVSVRPTAARLLRPGAPDAPPGGFLLTRKGPAVRPLTVGLAWGGPAQAGRDHEPLPDRVTFPAGKAEAMVPVQPKGAPAPLPTRELTCAIRPDPSFLMDGSTGLESLLIADGRAKRLAVARVDLETESWSAGWGDLRPNRENLNRLIDGSGLDRGQDPPRHSNRIQDQWYAEYASRENTRLVFDLGRPAEIVEARIWNANATSEHGKGFGEGTEVRHWARRILLETADSPSGPWKPLGQFRMRRPSGRNDEAGELVPIGTRARHVRIWLLGNTDMAAVGLSEVEFYGTP